MRHGGGLHRDAGDQRDAGDAQRVEHHDPADEVGDDPPGQLVRRPAALGQPAHDVRRDRPAEQEPDRRAGEHAEPAATAGEQRQPDRDQHQQQEQRQEAAPRPEHRAGEHHAERLGGDRHREPGRGERRHQAERGDHAGEGRDQREVAGGRAGSGHAAESRGAVTRPDSQVQSANSRAQSWLVAKVSQAWSVPFCRPVVNHRIRCSAEPCVQRSGSTRPEVLRWIRSSPTAAAASSARAMSSWVRSTM